MGDVEIIKDNEEILAIIIRKDFKTDGIKFFTPDDFFATTCIHEAS